MSEPAPRTATYDDVACAPAHMVAELVGGDLHLSPRPTSAHAAVGLAIATDVFGRYRRDRREGWVILPEPELHLGDPNPRSLVLVPDLAGWRRSRMPVMPRVAAFTLVPDWICEIVSPSNAAFDRIVKMSRYADRGVAWAWLVDPVARTIEVCRHDGAHWVWVRSHHGDGEVVLPPFEDAPFDVGAWWPEGEP